MEVYTMCLLIVICFSNRGYSAAISTRKPHSNTALDAPHKTPSSTAGRNTTVSRNGAGRSSGNPSSTNHKKIISLNDHDKFQWLHWTRWHCNCPSGSMSRTRNISYSSAEVMVNITDFYTHSFQRVVCDYSICKCNRKEKECDSVHVSCPNPDQYICILVDFEYDQYVRTKKFWNKIKDGIHRIWDDIKIAFNRENKEDNF